MGLTIVIMDDELLTVQSLTKLIPMCNQNIEVVGSANNGKEGFALIETLKPDIALVDINMPLLTGIEVIKKVKQERINTKIVVISAYREFEYAKDALNYGALAYLLKPLNIGNLKETLLEIQKVIQNEKKSEAIQVDYFEEEDSIEDRVITMVKKYCMAHYGEDISLEDISDYVSMSKNYFCSYFKRYTGDSFVQYLKKVRMTVAKEKLRDTNQKIITIAREVGYINDSHFCKLFKEEVGISPAEYRKKYI